MVNTQAEMALVGAMMTGFRHEIQYIAENMEAERIDNLDLREAYEKAMDLIAAHGKTDPKLLLQRMIGDREPEEIKLLLTRCAQSYEGNLAEVVNAVNDCYRHRELTKICSTIAFNPIPLSEINARMEQVGERIGELMFGAKEGLKSFGPEDYLRLMEKIKADQYARTRFSRLDGIIRGFKPKQFIVLAARPGVGKSAMAMCWAIEFARQGKTVGYYSLEMGREELHERMVANLSGVNLTTIQDRDYGDYSNSSVAEAANTIMKLPIKINDNPHQTVQSIRAEARLKQCDVVIVDYLQLLSSTGKSNTRNDEVAKMSRGLKQLAMELKIPVIAVSQLNRAKDSGDEPSLPELRDSGAIEQDANIVVMLWQNGGDSAKIACKVAKNRNGKTGELVFSFNGGLMKFEEVSDDVIRKSSKWKNAAYDPFD